MSEIKPSFLANVTLYATGQGGRATAIRGDWFSCPCKFHEKDFSAWDCRLLLNGQVVSPGETRRLGIVFLSPEIAPAFRFVRRFYLWDGKTIGEAAAILD